MAIKIPADVSGIRKKMAEAIVARKRVVVAPVIPEKKPGDRKAGQEAADARRKANEALRNAAEKEAVIKDLQDRISAHEKTIEELQPAAERWNKYDHRRKETIVAKFPKEEQAKVRKFDADALEALAEARGFTASGTNGATGGSAQSTGLKIGSLDDATKAAKTDPASYNKFMDDVAAGSIKLDAAGKVLA